MNATMQRSSAGRNALTARRAVPGNPSTREEAFPEEIESLGLDAKSVVLDIALAGYWVAAYSVGTLILARHKAPIAMGHTLDSEPTRPI